MLLYLILLVLTFVCPVISSLILVALWMKYLQFIRSTGVHGKTIDFAGRKRTRWILLQLAWLLVSSGIMLTFTLNQFVKTLSLIIFVVGLLWLLILALIAIYHEHKVVDVQALENDNDLDADTIRIFVEKRSLLFNTLAITITLVNVGLLLNLL